MSIIIATIIGLIILVFLVFIHEAGHFITAKLSGIKVLEFGFGFPPRVWGKKIGETTYSINWLPLGGFVRLLGEEEDSSDPKSFTKKPPWTRAVVVAAGVFINILFAVFLFYFIVGANSFQALFEQNFAKTNYVFGEQENFTVIAKVVEGSPADFAGIKSGDKVLSVNGNKVETVVEFQTIVKENLGKAIPIEVQNFDEDLIRSTQVIPRLNPPEGEGALGVGLGGDFALVSYEKPIHKIFAGFGHAANRLQEQMVALKSIFGKSIKESDVEPLRENVGGVIRIVDQIAVVVEFGGLKAFGVLLELAALISLILGVLNLLPIPALDGGRLYFILIEGISGYKLKPSTERAVHGVAFLILIFLVILIAINDIAFVLERRAGIKLF